MTYLLDTHVLLWWLEGGGRLPASHQAAIESARAERPLLVCGITLWEIATLVARRRVRLALPLRDWLERATAAPLVHRVDLTPAVASEVAALPESFHRDPADRIIVATARVHGAAVVTSDRRIIDSGVVPTVS
ncbi:MAG TPA: type II toxin-antitoxin system VapC family toxin [Planctomycetota bacterium]|nr:type II toxin-antitoxin system VapC family toxin [Planctomycetota bacterium]